MPGQEAVQSVNGPMTRTLADLGLYCESVVGAEPWHADPRCVPIPWRPVRPAAQLKIAIMWDDGMAHPTPPVMRALRLAVVKLEAAGHIISTWSSEDQRQGAHLLERMFVADGGSAIRKEIERSGEPWRPEMRQYEAARELPTSEMWQLHLERVAYQKKYLDRWNAAGIDAILCPTTPYSSVENTKFRHGQSVLNHPAPPCFSRPLAHRGETDASTPPPLSSCSAANTLVPTPVGFTGVYNVLDYSCLSFPSGVRVDSAVDVACDDSYKPFSSLDGMIQAECKSGQCVSPRPSCSTKPTQIIPTLFTACRFPCNSLADGK